MCGREPHYNIAPTQQVLAVRQLPQAARPEFVRLRWGLIPYWADECSSMGTL
jgi:putative SOS response-associated peptidase YedK